MKKLPKNLSLSLKRHQTDLREESEASPKAPDPYIVEVLPGLFMGDSASSMSRGLLAERGVGVVFNLCSHKCASPFAGELLYHQYELSDFNEFEIFKFFDEITGLIRDHLAQSSVVFVHCHKGISRAPTLVIAFLIRFHGMTYESASTLLRQKSKVVCPNASFAMSLENYQAKNPT